MAIADGVLIEAAMRSFASLRTTEIMTCHVPLFSVD
jgi:hypothetical protein